MTILVQFTNNAATTLASGITSGATSLTVASGAGSKFPTLTGSQYFYCTLSDTATALQIEIVKVTARSTDTFTIVRAQEGTTAKAYLAGDKVELRYTAAGISDGLSACAQLSSNNTFTGTNSFLTSGISTASISGMTTPLSVSQGGTGVATLTGLLKGNGTSAITGGYQASLTTDVTGVLPIANGGTSGNSALAARQNLIVGGLTDGTVSSPQSWTGINNALITVSSFPAAGDITGWSGVVKNNVAANNCVGIVGHAHAISTATGACWGIATEAWTGDLNTAGTNSVPLVGGEFSVISQTYANTSNVYGTDIVFKNRKDGGAVLGGVGTSAQYNKKSVAIHIDSQPRSSTEYCGWRTGIKFETNSLDRSVDGYAIGIDFSALNATVASTMGMLNVASATGLFTNAALGAYVGKIRIMIDGVNSYYIPVYA